MYLQCCSLETSPHILVPIFSTLIFCCWPSKFFNKRHTIYRKTNLFGQNRKHTISWICFFGGPKKKRNGGLMVTSHIRRKEKLTFICKKIMTSLRVVAKFFATRHDTKWSRMQRNRKSTKCRQIYHLYHISYMDPMDTF